MSFCHAKELDSRTLLTFNPAGLFVTKTPSVADPGLETTRIGYVKLNEDGYPIIVNEIHLQMRDLHFRITEAKTILEAIESGENPEHEQYETTSDCLIAISVYQGTLEKLDNLGVNAALVVAMEKLVARAHTRFAIVEGEDGRLSFTDVETSEYYLQAEAKRLCREHNSLLKEAGHTTGYMTPEQFYNKVTEMYSVPVKVKATKKRTVAKV